MGDASKVDVEHYNRNTRAMAEDLWSLTAEVRELEQTVRWQGYAIWVLVALGAIRGINQIVEMLP